MVGRWSGRGGLGTEPPDGRGGVVPPAATLLVVEGGDVGELGGLGGRLLRALGLAMATSMEFGPDIPLAGDDNEGGGTARGPIDLPSVRGDVLGQACRCRINAVRSHCIGRM